MGYCSLSDLVDRYGEAEVLAYTDRDRDGIADTALVEGVLADVDAFIDTHLAGRYSLPLTETPRVLTRIACELAREALMMASGARLDVESPERRAADAARTTLKDIARGVIHIGAPTPAASVGSVHIETSGRLWDRKDSGGYI